jgi:hypothetical protein
MYFFEELIAVFFCGLKGQNILTQGNALGIGIKRNPSARI